MLVGYGRCVACGGYLSKEKRKKEKKGFDERPLNYGVGAWPCACPVEGVTTTRVRPYNPTIAQRARNVCWCQFYESLDIVEAVYYTPHIRTGKCV